MLQARVTAESSVAQNSVNYRRNLMNLLRQTGDLLEAPGIAVHEAGQAFSLEVFSVTCIQGVEMPHGS